MKKEFNTILQDAHGTAWGENIIVPLEVVSFYKEKGIKRLLCSVNDLPPYHCALMPAGKGNYFIHVNKELRKKLKIQSGDTLVVSLKPDESKYGMYVPEEFTELIKTDPEGDKYFHILSEGKQRTLLHMMGISKKSETRLKKSFLIIEYLKENKGKLDFKALNQFIKEGNKNF